MIYGAFVLLLAVVSAQDVHLFNSAEKGMTMPAIGLGTGGYGTDKSRTYPECWADAFGCGDHTSAAVQTWLKEAGGVRLDAANSYDNQDYVQKGIVASGVSRSDIFILSKVGNSNAMGYNDTLNQWAKIKEVFNGGVDLLLNHWPTSFAPSTDPACKNSAPTYNATQCRVNTWKAMVEIWQAKDVRAIGVANYEVSDLQEFITAGLPLPAVNQIPLNPYRYATQQQTISWCRAHNITVLAYSPLGIPDLSVDAPKSSSLLLHKYPAPMSATLIDDPKIGSIAAAHKITPAQAVLRFLWQAGFPSNPRSQNLTHMKDNLAAPMLPALTADEMNTMSNMAQDMCSNDNWYECAH